MKIYVLILALFLPGILLQGCFDDDSAPGNKLLVPVEIQAAHDTIDANFGEELVVDFVQVNQQGADLPLTYEWGWANLSYSNGVLKPYPLKDSLKVISHDPQLKYAFRKLGTFGLRLKIDNGESVGFKYFILNINSGLDEGLTVLSRDETGKGRLSFLRTLASRESQTTSAFMTDVMEFSNPGIPLEGVTDMIQHKGWLLIGTEQAGRIYNMDSRNFQVQTMSSFASDFPAFAVRKFTGNSAQNYIYMSSSDREVYVYECENNVLLQTEYFEGVQVDEGYLCNKPFFVNYEIPELYSPKSAGINRSNQKLADYDVLHLTHLGSTVYVIMAYKENPQHVYIASTSATFGSFKKVQDYESETALNIGRNSLVVSSNAYKYVYYTSGNTVYRWATGRQLPTEAFLPAFTTGEITAIGMDPAEKLLYIGVYDLDASSELKGSVYVYDADTGTLVNAYEGIADRPVRIIYKERV